MANIRASVVSALRAADGSLQLRLSALKLPAVEPRARGGTPWAAGRCRAARRGHHRTECACHRANSQFRPCACRKLNPGISVMESAQDWATSAIQAGGAMKVLSSKIDEIGHFASNVASAMEEQSYATADISQNIESASQETGRVRGVLEETVKSADATRDAARKPCFF
jgi:hypothetical protein